MARPTVPGGSFNNVPIPTPQTLNDLIEDVLADAGAGLFAGKAATETALTNLNGLVGAVVDPASASDGQKLTAVGETTTPNAVKRGGWVTIDNKVTGGKAYGLFVRSRDVTAGTGYSHLVGLDVNVTQKNAFPAGGSDVFVHVAGITLADGVWPGAAHRVEWQDYPNWKGQIERAYWSMDGVTPTALEVGTASYGTDSNSQQVKFYRYNSGSRSLAGYLIGTRFDDLHIFATRYVRFNPNAISDGFLGIGGENGPRWSHGTGSPEGVVTARPGSIYSDIGSVSDSTLWFKRAGTGNTGWKAVTLV